MQLTTFFCLNICGAPLTMQTVIMQTCVDNDNILHASKLLNLVWLSSAILIHWSNVDTAQKCTYTAYNCCTERTKQTYFSNFFCSLGFLLFHVYKWTRQQAYTDYRLMVVQNYQEVLTNNNNKIILKTPASSVQNWVWVQEDLTVHLYLQNCENLTKKFPSFLLSNRTSRTNMPFLSISTLAGMQKNEPALLHTKHKLHSHNHSS